VPFFEHRRRALGRAHRHTGVDGKLISMPLLATPAVGAFTNLGAILLPDGPIADLHLVAACRCQEGEKKCQDRATKERASGSRLRVAEAVVWV